MNQHILTAFAAACVTTASASRAIAQSCERGQPVVFEGANVIAMTGSMTVQAQTVIVQDGRISSVGTVRVPEGACRIDARGKFLLPGLSDMHAHMTEADIPLFLANGITLVRELNGSPSHLDMRVRIDKGEIVGPRLVVTSPLLTGKALQFRHRLITSAADAFAAAHEASDAGYDFLKIYDDLSLEMYEAFVKAGSTIGLRLDGHIPQAVGLERVLAAGQSIQHMDKIVFALGGHSIDEAKLTKARAMFTNRSTWVTPTIASLYALGSAGSEEYHKRLAIPEMKYVDVGLAGWWRSMAGGRKRADGLSEYFLQLAKLTQIVKASGVRMLIGTDASNPLMIAGFSVHEEMEMLVRHAGFTRQEVLLAATRNAADFLGDSTAGRIQEGARADLLLVDGNPLEDLATLRAPLGVLVNGRWLDRQTLTAGLSRAVR